MNRLRYLLIFLFLISGLSAFSQDGFLFVKKGFHKRRIYTEGDDIFVKLYNGIYQKGIITLLRNDTVFINGSPIARPSISEIIIKVQPPRPFPADLKTMLLIAGGAALTTAGLIISKQATTKQALIAGPVIGFAPLLLKHFGSRFFRLFVRRNYKIGKKFHLQVLEFHDIPYRLKAF